MIKSQSDGYENLFQGMQNTKKKIPLKNVWFLLLSVPQALWAPLSFPAPFIIKAHSNALKNVTVNKETSSPCHPASRSHVKTP